MAAPEEAPDRTCQEVSRLLEWCHYPLLAWIRVALVSPWTGVAPVRAEDWAAMAPPAEAPALALPLRLPCARGRPQDEAERAGERCSLLRCMACRPPCSHAAWPPLHRLTCHRCHPKKVLSSGPSRTSRLPPAPSWPQPGARESLSQPQCRTGARVRSEAQHLSLHGPASLPCTLANWLLLPMLSLALMRLPCSPFVLHRC